MTAPGFLLGKARSARRLAAVSAAAAAISAASLAALPAAQAAAPAHGTAVHAVSGHQVVPARVITCKIGVTLRFPHPLDATGRLKCSSVVSRITIAVQIFRNGRLVRSRVFTRTLVRGLAATVGVRCVSAFYRARVIGKVKLPNGNVLTGRARTRQIAVSC